MNRGLIAGLVYVNGSPATNVLVGLDGVGIMTGQGMLPIYSTDADGAMDRLRSVSRGLSSEMPAPLQNLWAETQSNGGFALGFQWSGTDLGSAIDRPSYSIYALQQQGDTMRLLGRRRAPMAVHVDLRAIANGLIPDPTQLTDQIGMVTDVITALRQIRLPRMGFTIMGPSGDYFGLLGLISLRF
ncbi:MAG TPA: hypothetical protein VGF59_24805 [Bryobacteraceae bacterium]|jgi:hypothetical protein